MHLANAVGLDEVKGDHDRGDDLVADFGGLLHVAGNNMDSVPSAALHLSSRVHDLLHEEAGVEAIAIRVVEVDGRREEVVIELAVGLEDIVCGLLHPD